MNYKIGTRGSKLALVQANMVRARLQKAYPGNSFEICVIKTKGDKINNVPLGQIGDKGLFVTEIEEQIQSGEIQLGVHSMKDMPEQPAEGLVFAKAWEREDPRDALVLREVHSLKALPKGAVIGTGSKRRAFQLLALRSDLQIVDIRGNVDTRLRKMQEQKLDGIVLAAAGLKRLGMEEVITQYLEAEEMIPAPAQGVLAIEMRADQTQLLSMVNALADEGTDRTTAAERGFLKEIGGDCHLPIGAYCKRTEEGKLRLYAMFGNEDGSRTAYADIIGEEPSALAKEAADRIRKELSQPENGRGGNPGKSAAAGRTATQPSGVVTLVGAGPGDPGLLTVKGLAAIREADCIIYDRLAAPELLAEAKPGCEKIYVGKENHHHTMPQEEINRLLAEKAHQYPHVVRLKGGDVYVFGRGGEEGIYLKEHGVPCVVVPGVTSAVAGPAYAGIPITHRGLATGFRVITAHNQKDETTEMDFASMGNPKETLVFLMGLSKVGEIAEGLLNAGRAKDTPAAVISRATTAMQKSCVGTLETIAEQTRCAGLTSPALIVIGDVVSLREQQLFNFFEEQPLFGKRYLVPVIESSIEGKRVCSGLKNRNSRQSLAELLRMQGAEVQEKAVGRICVIPAAFSGEELQKPDWLVFSSRNGVTGFFENLRVSGLDVRCLANVRIAAIGPQTAKRLLEYGIQADLVSEKQNGTAFAEELLEQVADKDTVWYLSAAVNSGTVEKGLKDHCRLVTVPVYENREIPVSCELENYDGIFITCASSAARLFGGKEENRKLPAVYSIGPQCTQKLKELGVTEIAEAEEPSYEALAALAHLV